MASSPSFGPPRWKGRRGRTEVWYATFTDDQGVGTWIHYETVAPVSGRGAPYGHGWIAVFLPDEPPSCERFGPAPIAPTRGPEWFEAAGAAIGPGRMSGATKNLTWNLSFDEGTGGAMFTFPRTAWERELLPGAQIVPWPDHRYRGTITLHGREISVDARGALARIYGHGSAQRWGWLHAPLGNGEVLEIVTATARRKALRWLPPLALLQLRLAGEPDWPANPLLAAPRFRTQLALPEWAVRGVVGARRLTVTVTQPPARCVTLGYTDPDGGTATCTNTERADAVIVLEARDKDGWREDRRWRLEGTAHAEVGLRP